MTEKRLKITLIYNKQFAVQTSESKDDFFTLFKVLGLLQCFISFFLSFFDSKKHFYMPSTAETRQFLQ